ncbi:MAG: DMT family transporter [Deltaproteobacteria bacterium]|nr:MAG: DMT family transporter [Deltaproteobacteria bacterium]
MTPGVDRGRGAGIAAVVAALVGFSWGFVLAKLIAAPPPVIAMWRLAIGAAVLTAIAAALRAPWPRLRGAVLVSGIAFGVHQMLYVTSVQWTSVSVVALIGAAQPLLVSAVSRRTVGEPVSRALVACSALALAGVAVVVHADLGSASHTVRGDLAAIANLAVVTVYFLAAKRARVDGAPTLTLTAATLAIALCVVAPVAAATAPDLSPPRGRQLGYLLVLALGSGNCHLLVNWAHRRVSAALAALILSGLPILVGIWGHLVLGETLGWRHAAGMALVVASIDLARRAERRT